MRWFDRAVVEGPKRALFADVNSEKRRVPSWVPSRAEAERERRNEPSLKPPRLPSEFVSAVRHELGQELRARPSMPPPEARRSERPQQSLPPAPQPAVAAAAPPPAPPPPVVDPALIQAFEQAVLQLSEARERVLSETAGQLAELSVLIARRVIGRELSLDPTLVRGIVREGLEALGQHQRMSVRLGKAFAAAEGALSADLERMGETFEIHIDPLLPPYGCLVETELGHVDESIETRIDTLLQGGEQQEEA